jgi:hypothetical protein
VGGVTDPARWDVFMSYVHEDQPWVRVLAENLQGAGLEVFYDEWDVVGGARLAQRLQEGLARADVVVSVVSAAAVGKPWWEEEFAAATAGVATGPQRLVPVLLDEVTLPPFVASRVYADFRHLDSPAAWRPAQRLLDGLTANPASDPQLVGPTSRTR